MPLRASKAKLRPRTLRSRVYDSAGHVSKTVDYTFGNDEIAQTVTPYVLDSGQYVPDTSNAETHIFGHDGHGSVRVLYDLAEAVANAAQVLTFSAYGQMLAVHAVVAGAVATQASSLTSLGYSGEFFDAKAAQQYLRARFYNPATGTFNRLDPFAGNTQDPQSLHKYLYVHGDPVQGVDPTGRSLIGTVKAVGIRITIGAISGAAAGVVLNGIRNKAMGQSFFSGAMAAAILGGSFGAVIALVPFAAYGFVAYGAIDSIWVLGKVFSTPSTPQQKAWAATYLLANVLLGAMGVKYARSHAANARQTGRSVWYWTPEHPTVSLGATTDTQRANIWSLFCRAADKVEAQEVLFRAGRDASNLEGVQVSHGAELVVTDMQQGHKGLYTIDGGNGVRAVIGDPGHGSPQLASGGSKASGEFAIRGKTVLVNEFTTAGKRNISLAAEAFRAIGYRVLKVARALQDVEPPESFEG